MTAATKEAGKNGHDDGMKKTDEDFDDLNQDE